MLKFCFWPRAQNYCNSEVDPTADIYSEVSSLPTPSVCVVVWVGTMESQAKVGQGSDRGQR